MARFKKIEGGLTEEELYKVFPWLKDADFEDAVVWTTDDGGFFWDNGIWYDGQWCGDYWEDGVWENGIWNDGLWNNGTWKDGIWKDGVWRKGIWFSGLWKSGLWKRGTWKAGVWENGKMWSNTKESFIGVKQVDGKFIETEDEKIIKIN